jgi:methylated-DNA-[protein]-cysteine S-methyltransferase
MRPKQAGRRADPVSVVGGSISSRRLLSIEGTAPVNGSTPFNVLLPVAAPPRHN